MNTQWIIRSWESLQFSFWRGKVRALVMRVPHHLSLYLAADFPSHFQKSAHIQLSSCGVFSCFLGFSGPYRSVLGSGKKGTISFHGNKSPHWRLLGRTLVFQANFYST
jgi:hypothetical protein